MVVLQAAISLRDSIPFAILNNGEDRIKAAKKELLKARAARVTSPEEMNTTRKSDSV
jgi:hypothetical protein